MNAEYELLATPYVITEGRYKGQLKGILFLAVSPTDKMQWFSVNCGQFEVAFRGLLSHSKLAAVVESLMRGEEVVFPRRYRREQFDGGFHFAWRQPNARFKPPIPDTTGRLLWGV